MHLAVALAVFPVIFIGELPDKTMFASLVLATRGRPLAVWMGAAAAFLVHVVIATTMGVVLFGLVPHRVLEGIVAVIFLVGAALAIREAMKEGEHEEEQSELVAHEVLSHRRIVITAFVVIFLAEWGDLTQILTVNLAARYHSPFSVGVGALVALWSVAAIAVIGGTGMPRFLNVATIRKGTAVVLAVLAGFTGWSAIR
ncbi:MAG TPA: TMEM165/GDT1 family protein [Acidimicrobiales bacterium]|nr:TMEM165/GDT1 family protein [Acidimicrobiales bacterium]